jgi:hypothetical protein
MLSDVVSRMGLSRVLAGAWGSFGSTRDIYSVLGYPRALTFTHFAGRYVRDGVARRIVRLPAQDTWRNPPIVYDDDDRLGPFATAFRQLNTDAGLLAGVASADSLSGIGQYGGMLIGYSNSGIRLDLPVPPVSGAGGGRQIVYHTPLSQGALRVMQIETDTSNPRFGLPTMYRLQMNMQDSLLSGIMLDPAVVNALQDVDVHWTRILHLAEDRNESAILGTPRLQHVFNYLIDLEKVVGGAAETFWLTANRGLHINVNPELALDPADEEALSEEIDEYQHQLRRVLRTRGTEVKALGTDTADPSAAASSIIDILSAATNIPQRMLIGSERGELASDQDRAQWGDYIRYRQTNYAEPYILRPLVLQLIATGVLPKPNGRLQVEWPPAISMNEFDLARTAGHIARAALAIAQQRTTGVYVLTPEEFRGRFLHLPLEIAEQVQYFTPVAPAHGASSSAHGGAAGGGGGSSGGGASGSDGAEGSASDNPSQVDN